MNVEIRKEPSSARAEALYFDSGAGRLFGWLHRPAGRLTTGVGLVICKPFGYEAICSHRSLRTFAEAAAVRGIPALRFDYWGTGDAAEIHPQADQIEIWCQDVVAAAAELRRLTGIERICLLGFRLGALLATLSAGRCGPVAGLALIAPVISGRRFLKEMRTTRLAALLGTDKAASPGDGAKDSVLEGDGSMAVSGFLFSKASLATLAKVDLMTSAAPPMAEFLVIDAPNFPVARGWAAQSAERGLPTRYLTLPGSVEMLMTAPQAASIPEQMIATVSAWLTELPVIAPVGGDGARKACRATAAAVQEMSLPPQAPAGLPAGEDLPAQGLAPGREDKAGIVEHPVFFGSDAPLFGIVTEPHSPQAGRRAVILLNAGADYHIGASGLNVILARQWARHGYAVLRMDLAGLGDSGTRSGRSHTEIFPPAAVDDIRAAIEWMRSRYGTQDVSLCGFCSGAYHALRAATAAVPITRALLINPTNFFWEEQMSLADMQESELVSSPRMYRARMFSLATWKRLLTGGIDIRYVLRIYWRRLQLSIESAAREVARNMRIRLPQDLGRELEAIAARGVRLSFIFGGGEPGLDLLKMHGGSSIRRLGQRCRIHVIERADHVFSKMEPRADLERILSEELSVPAEAPITAPTTLSPTAPIAEPTAVLERTAGPAAAASVTANQSPGPAR